MTNMRTEGGAVAARSDLRKRENTRAKLLEAATDVFVAKGFEGARIDDIVKEAGFTRGAFYSNYASIEDLMYEVLVSRSEQILADLRTALAVLDDAAEIDAILHVLDAFSAEGRRIYVLSLEFALYRMRHPEFARETAEFPVAERTRIEEVVTELVDGVLARLGRRPAYPVRMISRILMTFYLDSLAPDRPFVADGDVLHDVAESVILAFSEPDEGAAPDTAGHRSRTLGPIGRFVKATAEKHARC